MHITSLKHWGQVWLDTISKLDDFDMIERINKGPKGPLKDAVRAFNFNLDIVSVDFEVHPWHITVSSKR